jgi:hypothetical protein
MIHYCRCGDRATIYKDECGNTLAEPMCRECFLLLEVRYKYALGLEPWPELGAHAAGDLHRAGDHPSPLCLSGTGQANTAKGRRHV